jgi:hypothetical protein
MIQYQPSALPARSVQVRAGRQYPQTSIASQVAATAIPALCETVTSLVGDGSTS